MPVFRLNRSALGATFVACAAASLMGCQAMLSTSSHDAPTAQDTPAFQRVELQPALIQANTFVPTTIETQRLNLGRVTRPAPALTVFGPPIPPINLKLHTSATLDMTAPPEALQPFALKAEPAVFESGIASTYGQGDGFEGERTGCGGIFHTHVIQVAHKSLPCGTLVRIEDTDTGKHVDAEVTDRGPYVAGRIVDLSYAAFTQLDPVGTGLLHVNVYILDTSNQYLYRLR